MGIRSYFSRRRETGATAVDTAEPYANVNKLRVLPPDYYVDPDGATDPNQEASQKELWRVIVNTAIDASAIEQYTIARDE